MMNVLPMEIGTFDGIAWIFWKGEKMLRFRITLRRYFDASKRISIGETTLFFPCRQHSGCELVEVGETRILEFALPEDDVVQLQHDYQQSNGADAVKSFVNNQLRLGGLYKSWLHTYNNFVIASVQQLHGQEKGEGG